MQRRSALGPPLWVLAHPGCPKGDCRCEFGRRTLSCSHSHQHLVCEARRRPAQLFALRCWAIGPRPGQQGHCVTGARLAFGKATHRFTVVGRRPPPFALNTPPKWHLQPRWPHSGGEYTSRGHLVRTALRCLAEGDFGLSGSRSARPRGVHLK